MAKHDCTPETTRKGIKRLPMTATLEERFNLYAAKSDDDGCWLWRGYRGKFGYGRITSNKRSLRAHRVAYEIYVGKIPDGLCVLHTCHNGHNGCCNPSHLKLGTRADNMQDRVEAGNMPVGEAMSNAKLTDEKVRQARQLMADGMGPTEVGRLFGVTRTTMMRVRDRKAWRHVT